MLLPEREENEDKKEGILSRKIKGWIFALVNEVISQGFALFQDNRLNKKQMKVYCSERLVFNLIQLIKEH